MISLQQPRQINPIALLTEQANGGHKARAPRHILRHVDVLEADLLVAEGREDGVMLELRAQLVRADQLLLRAVQVLREEVFLPDRAEECVELARGAGFEDGEGVWRSLSVQV